MKSVRVSTTVSNEACQEQREYLYKDSKLTVSIVMHPDKESYVWASYFDNDKTWTVSFGNLTISNIGEKDWAKLNEQVQQQIANNKEIG